MSDRPDLRDLVGEDLSPDELARLGRVDQLLRSVPPPPSEVPGSLTRAVERIGTATPLWTRRRLAVAVALAAALSALSFGIGRWTGVDEPDFRATVRMVPGDGNPRASAVIKLGERDAETGNWKLRLEVEGLPELGSGGYYVLWLAKDGEYAGTCGTFNVDGRTTVDMTVSYRLEDYDTWVISESREDAPWLFRAPI
jgi:hypothetical protein